MLLGLFFNPTIGTTHNVTIRIRKTMARFSAGFRATVGPRVAGSCTMNSCTCVRDLVFRDSGFAFLLLTAVSFPILLRARVVLRL